MTVRVLINFQILDLMNYWVLSLRLVSIRYFKVLTDGLKFLKLWSLLADIFPLLDRLGFSWFSFKEVDTLELLHALLGHWLEWIVNSVCSLLDLLPIVFDSMSRCQLKQVDRAILSGLCGLLHGWFGALTTTFWLDYLVLRHAFEVRHLYTKHGKIEFIVSDLRLMEEICRNIVGLS